MNGLTLLIVIAVAIGLVLAYRLGVGSGRRGVPGDPATALRTAATVAAPRSPSGAAQVSMQAPITSASVIAASAGDSAAAAGRAFATAPASDIPLPATPSAPGSPSRGDGDDRGKGGDRSDGGDGERDRDGHEGLAGERARLVCVLSAEVFAQQRALRRVQAERHQLAEFAEHRRALLRELATARAESARYRTLVVDIENNAPPPLLTGPNAPDDLKLIVGVGPMLERMLQQLGVTSYRQIARWNERDVDDMDARLSEFPGRIRRDEWVKQARALHQSKYGEALPSR